MKLFATGLAGLLLLLNGTGTAQAQDAPQSVGGLVQFAADQAGTPTQAVRSEAAGTITRVYASPGQAVKFGDVLAEMDYDQQLYQMNVAKAQAEAEGGLQTAEGQLVQRKADLEEARELYRRRQVAEYRVDSALGMVQWAEGQVRSIREQKEFQKISYDYWAREYEKRFIRSPFTGVVSEVKATEGQGLGIAAHAFTVGNPDAMIVTTSVPADQARALAIKDRVTVRKPGEKVFSTATVQEILDDPASNGARKLVRIFYLKSTPDEKIAPGKFDVLLPKSGPPENLTTAVPR